MGAFCLLPPGTVPGPCAEPCEHQGCIEVRALASLNCIICEKTIGYSVPIYGYQSRHGHADCIDAAPREALSSFARDLGRIFAELYIEGKLPFREPASEEAPPTSRKTASSETRNGNSNLLFFGLGDEAAAFFADVAFPILR